MAPLPYMGDVRFRANFLTKQNKAVIEQKDIFIRVLQRKLVSAYSGPAASFCLRKF